ncbi:MAG TPA: type II toxin-antitoxin system prevent-host-death family antitoxin [Microlunatus sp.]
MTETISIGELRQNPTRMLRAVKAGATYTITDHGEPVAEVVGIARRRWISSTEVDALLRELGADDAWRLEIDAGRSAEDLTDPWAGQGG